jgi:N-acetylglutamate synthase-like GNAT family acetyltransferase
MSAQKPFSVRRATPEDAASILEYLRAAFEPYRGLYTPAALEDTVLTPGTVGERLATMAVFVAATAGGEIVGTVACHMIGEEGRLRGMAVHPSWQGRGVAEELLAAAAAEHRRGLRPGPPRHEPAPRPCRPVLRGARLPRLGPGE